MQAIWMIHIMAWTEISIIASTASMIEKRENEEPIHEGMSF
jgi:hypothetical protein